MMFLAPPILVTRPWNVQSGHRLGIEGVAVSMGDQGGSLANRLVNHNVGQDEDLADVDL